MKLVKLLLSFYLVLFFFGAAFATDRYFDSTATGCSSPSDTDYSPVTRTCGAGGSFIYSTPQGASDAASAGDTVYLRGSYNAGSNVALDVKSGSSGSPITYSNYNGETVTLQSTNDGTFTQGVIELNSKSYVTINGLTIVGGSYGIEVYPSGSNLVFTNNNIYNSWDSCFVGYGANTVTFTGNEVHDCNVLNEPLGAYQGHGGSWGAGVTFNSGVHHITASGNIVYNSRGEGMSCYGGWGGQSDDVTFDGNFVSDSNTGNIYIDGCENMTVKNNMVWLSEDSENRSCDPTYGCGQASANTNGISFSVEDYGGTSFSDDGLKILNNIIVNGSTCIKGWWDDVDINWDNITIANNTCIGVNGGISLNPSGSLSNVRVKNNLIDGCCDGGGYFVYQSKTGTNVVIANNDYYGSGGWAFGVTEYFTLGSWESASGDSNSVTSNPLLVDDTVIPCRMWNGGCGIGSVDTTKYKLQSGSPMINQGAALTTVSSVSYNNITVGTAGYFPVGAIVGVFSSASWALRGTATVQAVNTSTNVVTLSSTPAGTISGDYMGIATDYAGNTLTDRPEIGAYWWSGAAPAPPTNLFLKRRIQ